MKVCHVTSVHRFNDNRIFYKEILSLNESGYDVCFIAPNAPESFEGIRVFSNVTSGGRIRRFFLQSLIRTLRHAFAAKADVYHLHDPELMPTAFLLRCIGKTIVFDVHENVPAAILSKSYIRPAMVRRIVSSLVDLAERFFFLFFDAIVTARPDISERLSSFRPYTLRNFPILPSTAELNEQAANLNLSKTKKSVIYVGGMVRIRGIKELVEAFDSLDEFELWLLGPFGSQDFENSLRQLNGWRNVRYFGIVEPHEIFGYVQKADAGIVTFWPEPNHVKTLATKPFEYMACGLPMIMSDFPYWRDFFGNSSLYVNPKDPVDIAKGIRKLLENEELLAEMGERNRLKSKTEFNWESERQELFRLYSDLAGSQES